MGTIVGPSCENKNTTRTARDRLQSVIPVRSVLSYYGTTATERVIIIHASYMRALHILLIFFFFYVLLLLKCAGCTRLYRILFDEWTSSVSTCISYYYYNVIKTHCGLLFLNASWLGNVFFLAVNGPEN